MTETEALAIAMIAEEGYGYENPPAYEDCDAETQRRYRERAAIILGAMRVLGFVLIDSDKQALSSQ